MNLRKEEELNNNKNIEEQMNQFNYNNIANNKKEKGLGESFMFNLKKFQSKEDLYKNSKIPIILYKKAKIKKRLKIVNI